MRAKIKPIPVTILTGFLGVGKTTLLNRILHAEHGLRIAVLVNDFGAVNIDTQLVANVEGETISMANGCICCTIRDDLLQAAKEIVQQPNPPEYIIVEPSGVSDPALVARTFYLLRPSVQVDSIIAVVDAEQIAELRGHYQILAINQVESADIILLNKVDLVNDAKREAIRRWVRNQVPQARIVETVEGNAPLELLLGAGNFDAARLAERPELDIHVHPEVSTRGQEHAHAEVDVQEHVHHHHDDEHEHHEHSLLFSTWFYTSDIPLNFLLLRRLMEQLPVGIFRAKGIVYLESMKARGILQMTGRRCQLRLGPHWESSESSKTQLVFIGEPGSIDPATLGQQIESCRSNINDETEGTVEDVVHWLRALAN